MTSDPMTAEDRAVEAHDAALARVLHAEFCDCEFVHLWCVMYERADDDAPDFLLLARNLRRAGFLHTDEARATIAAAVQVEGYLCHAHCYDNAARIARETKLGAERTDR